MGNKHAFVTITVLILCLNCMGQRYSNNYGEYVAGKVADNVIEIQVPKSAVGLGFVIGVDGDSVLVVTPQHVLGIKPARKNVDVIYLNISIKDDEMATKFTSHENLKVRTFSSYTSPIGVIDLAFFKYRNVKHTYFRERILSNEFPILNLDKQVLVVGKDLKVLPNAGKYLGPITKNENHFEFTTNAANGFDKIFSPNDFLHVIQVPGITVNHSGGIALCDKGAFGMLVNIKEDQTKIIPLNIIIDIAKFEGLATNFVLSRDTSDNRSDLNDIMKLAKTAQSVFANKQSSDTRKKFESWCKVAKDIIGDFNVGKDYVVDLANLFNDINPNIGNIEISSLVQWLFKILGGIEMNTNPNGTTINNQPENINIAEYDIAKEVASKDLEIQKLKSDNDSLEKVIAGLLDANPIKSVLGEPIVVIEILEFERGRHLHSDNQKILRYLSVALAEIADHDARRKDVDIPFTDIVIKCSADGYNFTEMTIANSDFAVPIPSLGYYCVIGEELQSRTFDGLTLGSRLIGNDALATARGAAIVCQLNLDLKERGREIKPQYISYTTTEKGGLYRKVKIEFYNNFGKAMRTRKRLFDNLKTIQNVKYYIYD